MLSPAKKEKRRQGQAKRGGSMERQKFEIQDSRDEKQKGGELMNYDWCDAMIYKEKTLDKKRSGEDHQVSMVIVGPHPDILIWLLACGLAFNWVLGLPLSHKSSVWGFIVFLLYFGLTLLNLCSY